MALYKRGNTWWIDFTTPRGERIGTSAQTGDRAQAQELHDTLKAEAWRVDKLGQRPSRTWDEAALKWLEETSHKATHSGDRAKLRWLQPMLTTKRLDAITRELIEAIARKKAAETSKATANRHPALIRAILRRAWQQWEWIERVPKITLYPESKRRIRWITPSEAIRLLNELPDHQRDAALFALNTGLRHANVQRLQWSQIDLERACAWIHADEAKGRRPIAVPLNGEALEALNRRRGKHASSVFTFRGEPIKQINTKAWKEALKRAGITDFRWHDLRHTWASWHVQNGTPLYTLQEMGAWQTQAMVHRYAHLSSAHLAHYAANLPLLTQPKETERDG
jgi:integrase